MDTSFDRQTDSVEWYTPPHIVESIGRTFRNGRGDTFDLDPCAPTPHNLGKLGVLFPQPGQPFAKAYYAKEHDGLNRDWKGRVWLNPPYGREMAAWMKKLSLHSNGIALIFARTETQAFFNHVWGKASGMFFLKGRLKFLHWQEVGPDEFDSAGFHPSKNSAGAPSVLISYDTEDSWENAAALKNCGLPGYFVDLTPTEVIWAGWKTAIRSVLEFGPLTLTGLYEWVNKCVHRPQNKHVNAKIRQTLNRYEELFILEDNVWRLRNLEA